MSTKEIKGGPGSGNWGHTGRPGKRGGSGTGSGGLVNNPKALGRYRESGGQNTKKHVDLIRKAKTLGQRNEKRADAEKRAEQEKNFSIGQKFLSNSKYVEIEALRDLIRQNNRRGEGVIQEHYTRLGKLETEFREMGHDPFNFKPFRVNTPSKKQAMGYSVEPARYAKTKMAVSVTSDGDFKNNAARLAENLGGKWSNREKAYIISKKGADTLDELMKEGNWTGNRITGRIDRERNAVDFKYKDMDGRGIGGLEPPHKLHPSPKQVINEGFKKAEKVFSDSSDFFDRNLRNKAPITYQKDGVMVVEEIDSTPTSKFSVYTENGGLLGYASTRRAANFVADIYSRIPYIKNQQNTARSDRSDIRANLRQAASVAALLQDDYGVGGEFNTTADAFNLNSTTSVGVYDPYFGMP